jgi:hypothetical protein
MIIEKLLAMQENLVITAIQLGWLPDVKELWEKWLDVVIADPKSTTGLFCDELLEEKCSTDEIRLQFLIDHCFISTEAEAYVASVDIIRE